MKIRLKTSVSCCIAAFWAAVPLSAQDIEKEFEEFDKQQVEEFKEFSHKADAEFDTFLRATWQKFEAFEAVPTPIRPGPQEPVVFDKSQPTLPPVTVNPQKENWTTVIPANTHVPMKVDVAEEKQARAVCRTIISFYGTDFEVNTKAIDKFVLTGNKEADVADAWKNLCNKKYQPLINDCLKLKEEKCLSDWAYLLFCKQIGKQLYGEERSEEIAFLQMFLLCKSGYKVKLAKIDGKLGLLIPVSGTIYEAPYIMIGNEKYYLFESTKRGEFSLHTYKQNFADAKNPVCLNIDAIPSFSMKEQEQGAFPFLEVKLKKKVKLNRNLINFYKDYPSCGIPIHYKTPLSEELRTTLYPQLKELIKGKTETEAAGLLLKYVQGFQYMTDKQQFGYEKTNFPDETFYYPFCDCEDRAMLYSTLVKDLLGLETVLLDYPNHVASGVKFTEEVEGDRVKMDDGTQYLICDPTYKEAPIGKCMSQYRKVNPAVIR